MPSAIVSAFSLAVILSATVIPIQADPNDWVNVNYVLQQASEEASTTDAKDSIVHGADTTAKNGPWSVTNSHGIVAPSGDLHDYLSWAPYHWPNCNWCSSGSVHLAHNSTDDTGDDSDSPSENRPPDISDSYPDGSWDDADIKGKTSSKSFLGSVVQADLIPRGRPIPVFRHRSKRMRRFSSHNLDNGQLVSPREKDSAVTSVVFSGLPTPLPTGTASDSDVPTSETVVYGTPAPAQAPARTRNGGRSSCTPSPTSSLAPSATWTTCPYVVRDGQVNPDVRTLNGPGAINSVSQSILYNAVAYTFKQSRIYSQNVASFVDTYFLDTATKMNPNMNFGQIVRGPGKAGQSGTFTGILDLRGIVKVVNGILVLKGNGSPEWTSKRDEGMKRWITQYSSWLEGSELGKSTASRANNHNTFYISQLAAAKMFVGDNAGATAVLQKFFSHQFLDQVAASGEQPFEAVRTRPFHYRCFNLEALIVNAKLGDQLGVDFWSAKSKYGATIQTALDFTMGLNPKSEDIEEIVPHVASIAAAYGDPTGKYMTFMTKTMISYRSRPFWFYDQTAALPSSPAAKGKHPTRSLSWARQGSGEKHLNVPCPNTDESIGIGNGCAAAEFKTAEIGFECPAVFHSVQQVELGNGVFVTCDQLEPFYEYTVPR